MPVGQREAIHDLVGVATAFAAIMIYNHFLPSLADVRTAQAFDPDIEAAERTALVASTGFVLVTAGITQSLEVFIIGGLAIVAVDFAMKHANAVNPDTGKLAMQPALSGVSTSFPMPDYSTSDEAA